MERFAMAQLLQWSKSKRRKPLLLIGARQVGKTWLLQEFGRAHYEDTVYLNLDDERSVAKQRFDSGGMNLQWILEAIRVDTGQQVVPGKTLLILDEIQACPRALTSLKYFAEQMPNLDIAAAGSLLGLTFHKGTGFPVGKVNMLNLYPLSFREYLKAAGHDVLLDIVDSDDTEKLNAFATPLIDQLREYYYVGGMPDAVASFIDSHDYTEVRSLQNSILDSYRMDFSKHADRADMSRILEVWKQIPDQLSNEMGRFVFGQIRQGARGRDYASALTWLEEARVTVRVSRIDKPALPISAYTSPTYFKLYMTDIGLLGAMAGLGAKTIMTENEVFQEFKGALTEQYVCQQLISECGVDPTYWKSPDSRSEIDFVVQKDDEIYALEVKSAENLRSKSLRAFHEKYPFTKAVRYSLSGYRDQEWMLNVPLYAIGNQRLWMSTK